jgi:hypothetical protein
MEIICRRALSRLLPPRPRRWFIADFCSTAVEAPPRSGAIRDLNNISVSGGESVCAAVERLEAVLRVAGVPEPELSSRYLVSQAVGGQRVGDYLRGGGAQRRLSEAEAGELGRLVNCRLARMPLQYIAGNWDFRGITLLTRPPVFIPRQVAHP